MESKRNIRRSPVTVEIPTSESKWINPSDNPTEANETISKLLEEVNTTPLPEVDFPTSDIVSLPGGLVRKDSTIKTVEVKELTGEDEEALAKSSQSSTLFSFIDRLIRCGVVRVGDEPLSEKDKLLSQLLIGDREAIILGIRRATYGDEIEIEKWQCPNCGSESDLTLELDDIPFEKLNDPSDSTFKVKLRKGGYAIVRLANGSDQLAVYEKPEYTVAQQQTILLSRCVSTIVDSNGIERSMQVFPSMSRQMSMPDRHSILRELEARQPGPKYDKVKFNCASCDKEQQVTVTIGHLFLDFGWF